MTEVATDCDRCGEDIPYGVTCYAVATGSTWDGDDADNGKPVVTIECAACYTGPARCDAPTTGIYQKDAL